jgi:hypothetical protein
MTPGVVEEEVAAAFPEDRAGRQHLGAAAAEAVQHDHRAVLGARVGEVPPREAHAVTVETDLFGLRQAERRHIDGAERGELLPDQPLREQPRDCGIPDQEEHGHRPERDQGAPHADVHRASLRGNGIGEQTNNITGGTLRDACLDRGHCLPSEVTFEACALRCRMV